MIGRGAEGVPRTADLVILGSGVAGLTAALTGALEGLSCVVLEHHAQIGGTSARSSGSVWIPANRAMQQAGKDDRAAARQYLDALVGDRAPVALREAFLSTAPRMQADLEDRAGIGFRPLTGAADYRQDIPGAAAGWRALDPLPFDGRDLGNEFVRVAPPLPELMLFGGMMVTRPEAAQLLRADRSPAAAWLGLRLVARFLRDRLTHPRGTRLVLGNALVARLLHACLDRGVTVVTSIETADILRDGSRVTGVALARGGNITARRGVVLAGGGFPASPEWRKRELPAPTPRHTPAAEGAVGRTLDLGLAAGATLGPSGLDNALWFPSSIMQRPDGSTAVYPHIVLDRAKPGSIVVDSSGHRFVNEAVSYHEFVRGMYRGRGNGPAVPAWMICDRAFIRKYGLGLIRPRTPILSRYLRNGYLITAPDVGSLAVKLGIPEESLNRTVTRFNENARRGVDPEFGRGQTLYERNNGDAAAGGGVFRTVLPPEALLANPTGRNGSAASPDTHNPCLAPIGPGPLYAVRLEPTPLGTSRGLTTDTDARALDREGQPISGLYVCGNDMQSVFGGEYPGAGAQLGQAMCFAWRAARHAAGLTPQSEETL